MSFSEDASRPGNCSTSQLIEPSEKLSASQAASPPHSELFSFFKYSWSGFKKKIQVTCDHSYFPYILGIFSLHHRGILLMVYKVMWTVASLRATQEIDCGLEIDCLWSLLLNLFYLCSVHIRLGFFLWFFCKPKFLWRCWEFWSLCVIHRKKSQGQREWNIRDPGDTQMQPQSNFTALA